MKIFLRYFLHTFLVLFVGAFAAFLINTFVITNALVPSASMETTIMTGDRLIGNKLGYAFSEPQRGDIIIFKFPDDERMYFIKRIIAVGGDSIDIINNQVYINHSSYPIYEPYLKEPMVSEDMHFEVPEGAYFCMGDNRNNSNDSRFWTHHFVYRDKIIAKAVFRFAPSFKPLH